MSAVTLGEEVVVADDPDWYWRVSQPITGPDVEIELAPLFNDWDGDDLQRLLHVLARKLQYTASLLLSSPLVEDDEEEDEE